jgi:biopolymer transport protein ExbB
MSDIHLYEILYMQHRKFIPYLIIFMIAILALPTFAMGGEGNSNFDKFFISGKFLVWAILFPLSMITTFIIIQNLAMIRKKKLMPSQLTSDAIALYKTKQYKKIGPLLRANDCFLGNTLHVGFSHASNSRDVIETAMSEIIDQQTTHLMRSVEWLNIIGNVAPMIGLFGTVWGMINSFDGIVQAGGQPEPSDLAGGISVALVTTWWGLVVAIPALTAYGFFRNRIDAISADAAVEAESLITELCKS